MKTNETIGISSSFSSGISRPFNTETHSVMFLLSFIILVIFEYKKGYEKNIVHTYFNCFFWLFWAE